MVHTNTVIPSDIHSIRAYKKQEDLYKKRRALNYLKNKTQNDKKKKARMTCNKRSYKRTSSSGLVTFSFLSSRRLASLLFATLTNKRLRSMVLSAKTALTALSRPFKSSFALSALPAVA